MQTGRDGDVTIFTSVTQNAGDGIVYITGMGHRLAIRGLNLGASANWARPLLLGAVSWFHNSRIILAIPEHV